MRINVNGKLKNGVSAKDVILYVIAKLTTGGGTGYFIEYAGDTIRSLSMEERMTICNMSIEMGARGGLIAPDETTFDYVKGRKFAPKTEDYEKLLVHWKTLFTDDDAVFDKEYSFDAGDIDTMITYGTNPGMGIKISDLIPSTEDFDTESEKNGLKKSLNYMDLQQNEPIMDKAVNYVFIGSCTNGRIEDLRTAASIIKGRKKADNITAWIVPGSKLVEEQAEKEGLTKIFADAGIKMRQPGCSACLAMNDDKIPAGEYCVSTSNRNFEGRQGPGGRTHLLSPAMAAAAAIAGHLVDVRELG